MYFKMYVFIKSVNDDESAARAYYFMCNTGDAAVRSTRIGPGESYFAYSGPVFFDFTIPDVYDRRTRSVKKRAFIGIFDSTRFVSRTVEHNAIFYA